jgi:hypothetical protein
MESHHRDIRNNNIRIKLLAYTSRAGLLPNDIYKYSQNSAIYRIWSNFEKKCEGQSPVHVWQNG